MILCSIEEKERVGRLAWASGDPSDAEGCVAWQRARSALLPASQADMRARRALALSAVLAVAWGTKAALQAGNAAFQTGNAHYARGELEEAREAYHACLREQPERTDCATNLASVLVDLGPQNEALAEALYRRVLAIDENHADAAFNLALLLQDRKTEEATRECVALYQVVVAADPQLPDAWSNLASAYAELRNPVQAVRASQRAIVLLEQARIRVRVRARVRVRVRVS